MILFRFPILLSFAAFCWGVNVSAQTVPFQQQPSQQPNQSQQAVQQRVQQAPVQQQTMQVQPMQAPLFGTQGGTSVYQQNPNSPQLAAQPAVPQASMGMNAGQANVGQPTNMGQPINTGIPMNMGQPIRVAAAHPGQPGVPAPAGQQILYNPNGTNQVLQTVQPAVQGMPGIPPGMQHMGRAEPANRVIPFFLNADEQKELDEFLARWERYSAAVHRYDVSFNLFLYDSTIPGAQPNRPYKTAFGYFKYNANPRRFVYAVEGEWQGETQIKWDDKKNPNVLAEKVIIDERSVYQYDYKTQTLRQIDVPPEMIGKGIADSPLPLIFGAKADDLKRRFSMQIEKVPGRDDIIWLHARPLQIEDQQEFKELEILLDKKSLTAQGLKQWDINGKAYRAFELQTPQINRRVISVLQDIAEWFTPDAPRGWKRDKMDWIIPPSPVPAAQQPQMGNPPQRNEVLLY